MTELEQRLRAAMHAAVDAEEAAAEQVLRGVYRRHRRHTMLAAGVAVLLAVAVAVPVGIVANTRAGSPAPADNLRTPQLPAKMTGLTMPAATNLRLLVQIGDFTTGNQKAAWYSTRTRTSAAIAGVPEQDVFQFTRVTGGWSLRQLLVHLGCPPLCLLDQYFVADGSTQATAIGTGIELVASSSPGQVWLLSYAGTVRSMATASAAVQLFSTTGQALGPSYQLPAGYLLVRGIGGYLLLSQWPTRASLNMTPYRAVLWDPRSGRVVGSFADVLGAGPDEIAWSSPGRGSRVRLLNVLTGTSVTTPIPWWPSAGLAGTFTDDGTLLAVRLRSGQLAVYNTSSRVLTTVPGTAVRHSQWQTFGWLNGSHTLVVTLVPCCGAGPDQLGYWQPGDTQLRIATVTDEFEIGALQGWAS